MQSKFPMHRSPRCGAPGPGEGASAGPPMAPDGPFPRPTDRDRLPMKRLEV